MQNDRNRYMRDGNSFGVSEFDGNLVRKFERNNRLFKARRDSVNQNWHTHPPKKAKFIGAPLAVDLAPRFWHSHGAVRVRNWFASWKVDVRFRLKGNFLRAAARHVNTRVTLLSCREFIFFFLIRSHYYHWDGRFAYKRIIGMTWWWLTHANLLC